MRGRKFVGSPRGQEEEPTSQRGKEIEKLPYARALENVSPLLEVSRWGGSSVYADLSII